MAYSGIGRLGWVGMAITGMATLAAPRAAFACGGGGIASQAGVVVDSQRVVISTRASGTTDIVAQISVPQTSSDYGVLIPVPSEPTLDREPVATSDLTSLDEATRPRILVETGGGSSGCGCGTVAGDSKGSAPTRGVTAGPPVEIGPVVAVSLTGDSDAAILAWLADNGFLLPADASATLASYVGPGNYFIAIRRSDSAATFAPSSIGIHYSLKGDHRKLSLAFTRIGAAETMAYTVFLGASEAIGPTAPFAALTLNDLDATALRQDNYRGAIQSAVAARGSKAFVLESSSTASSVVPPGLAHLFDAGAVVTRATTVVSREELSEDVVFATAFKGEVPNSRFASQSVLGPRSGSFGSLGLVMVAGVLRRRRQRGAYTQARSGGCNKSNST